MVGKLRVWLHHISSGLRASKDHPFTPARLQAYSVSKYKGLSKTEVLNLGSAETWGQTALCWEAGAPV